MSESVCVASCHVTMCCITGSLFCSPEAAVSTGGWETVREELPQTQEVGESLSLE